MRSVFQGSKNPISSVKQVNYGTFGLIEVKFNEQSCECKFKMCLFVYREIWIVKDCSEIVPVKGSMKAC